MHRDDEESDHARLAPSDRHDPMSKTMKRAGLLILSFSVVAIAIIVLAFVATGNGSASSAHSTPPPNGTDFEGDHPPVSSEYRRPELEQLALGDVWRHLQALQNIADQNNGTRAVGSPGFDATVRYVFNTLNVWTGSVFSSVIIQPYHVLSSVTNNVSLAFGTANATGPSVMHPLTYNTDFNALSYSPSGKIVSRPVFDVGDGCETEDFDNFPAMTVGGGGTVAVIMRGSCTFRIKAENAAAAGAVAAIIVNTADASFLGTLGSAEPLPTIPVVGVRSGVMASVDMVNSVVSLETDMTTANATSANVVATTIAGDADNLIVFGSHTDSVPAGPGMNDDASGTSVNLALMTAIAHNLVPATRRRAMGGKKYAPIPPVNKLIFAFWGGEELGLTGSKHYVSLLSDAQRAQHAANFNMDMLGSPNFERGVFDATDDGDYPVGCAQVSRLIMEAYSTRNLSYLTSQFDGRSDYGSFVDGGIAAGGIYTGAEKIKSMQGRTMFGGLANAAYDTCYHQACDTLDNVNQVVLMQETSVAAGVLEFLADDKDIRSWLSATELHPSSHTGSRRRHSASTSTQWKPKRVGSEYIS